MQEAILVVDNICLTYALVIGDVMCVDVHVPTNLFYDGTIHFHDDLERVGGVTSHLLSEMKQELQVLRCQQLGVDTTQSQRMSMYRPAFVS